MFHQHSPVSLRCFSFFFFWKACVDRLQGIKIYFLDNVFPCNRKSASLGRGAGASDSNALCSNASISITLSNENCGERSEKLVSIWKRLHTEVSLTSVVCLEFPFMSRLALLLWVCRRQLFAKSVLCNNLEAPSNSIRLERLTMTPKIPPTHTKKSGVKERANLWCQGEPPAYLTSQCIVIKPVSCSGDLDSSQWRCQHLFS